MMYKYKLTLEYEGTRYSGWQAQKNARSVQGELIKAAQQIFKGEVDIQGAGRTDAGVHALAQVAHLGIGQKLPLQKILYGLNDILPHDISVLKVEEAPARFHARHHAVARSYLYLISKRRTAFGKRFVWWVKDDLDAKKMKTAMQLFSGFHDFISFADKRMDKDASTKVSVEKIEMIESENLILFRIVGSHFLWKMVRRIVGVLVEVGRKNYSVEDVEQMLAEYSDKPAINTAPPSGLFLAQVLYEGDELEPLSLPAFPFIFDKH